MPEGAEEEAVVLYLSGAVGTRTQMCYWQSTLYRGLLPRAVGKKMSMMTWGQGAAMQCRFIYHLHHQEQEVQPLHLPEEPLQHCEEFPSI